MAKRTSSFDMKGDDGILQDGAILSFVNFILDKAKNGDPNCPTPETIQINHGNQNYEQ
jgi:hypothetical protein